MKTQPEIDARVLAGTIGVRSLWVPITDMYETATSAAGALVYIGSTGTISRFPSRPFDPTSDEFMMFTWAIPKNYLSSAGISFIPIWAPTTTDMSGNVQWEIRAVDMANGASATQTIGGDLCMSSDTPDGTVENIHIGPESARKYLNSFTKQDLLCVRVMRRAATPDDYTGDASLIGIRLFWTTDAPTED